MGTDKASLLIRGEPLAARLARLLRESGWEPCVLGPAPVPGFAFQADLEPGAGPLAALRGFAPHGELCLVLSCDVALFRPEVAGAFAALIEGHDAVAPVVAGRVQPLCALYRASAWGVLRSGPGLARVTDWLARLDVRRVDERRLLELGLRPAWVTGANTPSELIALLAGEGEP
jgi:molybdopterin-guanine dinucleotide biosynthesis protein A